MIIFTGPLCGHPPAWAGDGCSRWCALSRGGADRYGARLTVPVTIMADNPLMTVTIVVVVADVAMMVSRYSWIAAGFLGLSRRHIAVAPACLLAMAPSRRTRIAMPANFVPPVIVAVIMMNANPPVVLVAVTVFIAVMMLITVVAFATIVVLGCGHSTQCKCEYQKQRKTQSVHIHL